jgi:hypothetical protein
VAINITALITELNFLRQTERYIRAYITSVSDMEVLGVNLGSVTLKEVLRGFLQFLHTDIC